MLIDIHCHSNYSGEAYVVVRNLFHNQAHEIEAGRWYSIGIHPWHLKEETLPADLEMVREAANHPQVLLIGEAGLDKSIKTSMELQLRAFRSQADIAFEINKPVIIHCVRAYNEILEIKSKLKHKKPWIVHWFNASPEMGEQLIKGDFYLSFGHMLFNNSSKAYSAFPYIPADRIFFETDDAGYTIDEVYKRAAFLRNMNQDELQEQVKQNFIKCFGSIP